MAFLNLKIKLAERLADLLAAVFGKAGERDYRFLVDALWQRQPLPPECEEHGLDVRLYYPSPVPPNPDEALLISRIFTAYQHAKADQGRRDAVFLPSRLWRGMLRRAYAPLLDAADVDDVASVHEFLSNFRASTKPTGLEESFRVHDCSTVPHRRRHYEERIIRPLVLWWLRTQARGRDLSALTLPRYGNQCGAKVNGHLISTGEVISEVHGRLLSQLLPRDRPRIAELGGGYGRLAFFTLRELQGFSYVGFDLPEVLCCASYFLLKTFPEKRFCLYGEDAQAPVNFEDYDFVLLPSFEIQRMKDSAVDLFINDNSLGEVEPAACRLFIAEMCRASRALWHRNHQHFRNDFDDGLRSLVNHEYPIPPEFEEAVSYCDVGELLSSGRPGFETDLVWYYYRRRRGTPAD